MTVQQPLQAAQCRDLRHRRGPLRRRQVHPRCLVQQVLPECFLPKEGLDILGQHRRPPLPPQPPPLGGPEPGQQVQHRGFPRSIPSQKGQQLPPSHRQGEILDHIRPVSVIAEPEALRLQQRLSRGRETHRGQVAQRV